MKRTNLVVALFITIFSSSVFPNCVDIEGKKYCEVTQTPAAQITPTIPTTAQMPTVVRVLYYEQPAYVPAQIVVQQISPLDAAVYAGSTAIGYRIGDRIGDALVGGHHGYRHGRWP